MKRIMLLGATGSIGTSTLDVIRSRPDDFRLVAATAHTDRSGLEAIASEFAITHTALTAETGIESACDLVGTVEADIVVNAISGASGLRPSVTALERGIDLALANKETIVMAGDLVRDTAGSNCRILPVDSEHAALFYLLEGTPRKRVSRLVLTASGGAFRDLPAEQLKTVSPSQALSHPTWDMGPKITIDSATMANKALEVIEAVRLFDVPESAVDVYIHRQSTVHGLVRTTDGSFYAQMSAPDMRVPIQHALTYPDEFSCQWGALDLDGLTLTFESPDPEKYPILELARAAIRQNGEYPAVFNAANEVAVQAFVDGRIRFTEIATVVEASLAAGWSKLLTSFDQVYEVDSRARNLAGSIVSETAGRQVG